MALFNRAERNALAADRDRCADRSERNAASGEAAAANPTNPPHIRQAAAQAARNARQNAAEYRQEAANLRG